MSTIAITDDMSTLEVALALAGAGFYVFPVDHPELAKCAGMGDGHRPGDPPCTDRGKHNHVAFTHAADVNPKMIHTWWAGNPRNVGINVGKSGLIVIDEDQPDGFAKYAADHGVEIPDTFQVKTGKGQHYYFLDPEQGALGNAQGALKEYGIDVRSGNAYVVGPGSVHASGVRYTVENDHEPAPLPAWVVQAIKAKTNGRKTDDDGVVWETVDGGSDRFELPEVIKDRTRDTTLFQYASSLLARELPRHEAEILMRSAWGRCEQPPKAKDTYPVDKALAKLDRYDPGRSEGYEKQGANDDRPRVDVRNDALAAEWLRLELGRRELAGIFRRDNLLVHTPRMGEEGYLPPEDLGLIDAGPAQVRLITTAGVKALVETRHHCWRTITVREDGENGKKESVKKELAALFPQSSAQSACEAARLGEHAPNLRTLHGVTHTPMMRPDGSILDLPGYDKATGFLYLPDPDLKMPPIPDQPTSEEINTAVDLILKPIEEFPFVSNDDRATWIGLAFTPALRPVLPGPYQMGAITATNPGSGKTLLTKLLTILHGGVQRGEMPRDADELRKSITAALMDTTAPIITFDNLRGVVQSAVLESLLTTRTWTDRWLGQNRSVTATNDRLWLATGNNAQFGGDLARRIATVALDPPEADPHLRNDFKIKNLDVWMHEHRGEYLSAILTVARGWVNAGRPTKDVRSDDYAGWVKGITGLMGWAGFPGTFGGNATEVGVSSDDEEWHHFLVALFKVFGSTPFTTKDLVDALGPFSVTGNRLDAAELPGDLADKFSRIPSTGSDGGLRRSVGKWMQFREGRYASRWKLRGAGRDGHSDKPLYVVCPPQGYAKP